MLEKRVPLVMDAGGGRSVVGHADVKIHENGEIELQGHVTDPHISDLITGDPKRSPLFAIDPVSPFSIGPNENDLETS